MNERTAQQSHKVYKVQVLALLDDLRERVRAHGEGEKVDWGHVGDLAYTKDQLVDLVTMLKGDE